MDLAPLRRIPLLAGLDDAELGRLAAVAETVELAPGAVIIREGDTGDSLFVVLAGELDAVRGSSGKNSVHMNFNGDASFLALLPGVERASVQTNEAELCLSPGTDPETILAASVGRVRITRFEIARPSLEEIFIERVGASTLDRPPSGQDVPAEERP